MKPNSLTKCGLLLGSLLALTAPSAMAAWTFPNGNLLLGFQASGGQGSTTNVFFDLGSATAFRDNPNQGLLGNIGADLAAAYGANWYSRTDLHFGVVGNLNFAPNSGLGSAAAVDGDPSRTFYVSAPTIDIGSGALQTGQTGNSLGVAGNYFAGQEAMVRTLTATANGTVSITQGANPTEWANGWTTWNTVGGSSYSTLAGIQDTFGQSGSVNYLDIQRIISTNTGANPAGTVGTGAWVGTIGIGNDGSLYAIPEPSAMALAGLAGIAAAFRRRRTSAKA
ncbi:PEP-CTERM sorting domain-containing protein [Luteolibacter flavescens]|uniref:PEP-CTERM sorting domain-containing protein n=1 Tax=Luteolibacter flavescens TaxID=1859460 RepID=A0ABT3FN08_9BACT|nr:PEP-CTERM sorting domain-containing protein [Luteolibacter flavescens]MCW1884956.1 PEP-CTERM sorting domain-containing protein [Luteolibacter flavescens]